MFRSFLVLLALLCFASLSGQKVIVIGNAKGFVGKEIELVTYTDLISLTEQTIDKDTINAKSFFKLEATIDKAQAAYLKIGDYRGRLIIEPNQKYRILFPTPDTADIESGKSLYSTDLEFILKDSLETNAQIMLFNEDFNRFWNKTFKFENASLIKNRKPLDSLLITERKKFAPLHNAYVSDFVEYTMADIYENTGQRKEVLYEVFLHNKQIKYDNHQYMQFFNAFFKQYLQKLSTTKEHQRIFDIVNEDVSYTGLISFTANAKYLSNDTLRELVILKCLYELYYVPEYSKDKIVRMLEDAVSQTKIPKHKEIAIHLLKAMKAYNSGVPAPRFTLLDKSDRFHRSEEFKGKFIYLDFWATWCKPCLQEMKKTEQLHKKYGDRIAFVSISTDDNMNDFKKFVNEHPQYKWLFLHDSNDKKIKEKYHVFAYPHYIIISPDGTITNAQAPSPSENIELIFKKILNIKDRRQFR